MPVSSPPMPPSQNKKPPDHRPTGHFGVRRDRPRARPPVARTDGGRRVRVGVAGHRGARGAPSVGFLTVLNGRTGEFDVKGRAPGNLIFSMWGFGVLISMGPISRGIREYRKTSKHSGIFQCIDALRCLQIRVYTPLNVFANAVGK